MLASIIIAAHNEGDLLGKTLESCVEVTGGLDCEIIIADDATSDGSVEAARRRFPALRVVGHPERRGCSAAKDLGARAAKGDVLVFLDGHCKPERFGIVRLVEDVVELGGKAIVTPRVPSLHVVSWKNQMFYAGHGYRLDLETLDSKWIGLDEMRPHDRFHESPSLVGCCLAMSRDLYATLWGFDPNMLEWGIEDIDFGLKAWLMGHSILHDPAAIIGHRFRSGFDNFSVAMESFLVNQLRLGRKCFTEPVWKDWLDRFRQRQGEELWTKAWDLYLRGQESAEREREYLHANRVHDEFWYAERFGLGWPVGGARE